MTDAIIALRARQEEAERLAGHLVEQWPGAAQLCQAVAEVHAEALALLEAGTRAPSRPAGREILKPATAADLGAEKPGAPAAFAGGVWTAERDALLIENYSKMAADELLAALNALPGFPVASPKGIKSRVCALRAAGTEVASPPIGRPRSAAPPAQDAHATIPADDIEEARQMMRASDQCGAKQLHEYFGWPMPQAQEIAATIRAEMREAQAA